MLSLPPASGRARAEHGFTLIELLVAMLTGVVITFALYAILEVSTKQTTLIDNKVQANQSGRLTMTKIVDELHSACFAESVAPVLEGSSATKLVFENAYTEKAEVPTASESAAEGVYKHEIVAEAESGATPARLVDKAYPSTAITSWPSEIAFSSTAKSVVLGEYITQETEAKSEAGKTLTPGPLFNYYEYNGTTGATTSLKEIPAETPLTKAIAAKVAAVGIHFRAWPKHGKAELESKTNANAVEHAAFNLGSQVTLAFTSPASETPIKDSPCA